MPVGSYIETEGGYYFVKSSSSRLKIPTARVLESWAPQRVIKCTEADGPVRKLKVTAKMPFRNGSLIWCISDGRLYLIESGLRRHIKSPDVLNNYKGTFVVSEDEMKLHSLGEDLT